MVAEVASVATNISRTREENCALRIGAPLVGPVIEGKRKIFLNVDTVMYLEEERRADTFQTTEYIYFKQPVYFYNSTGNNEIDICTYNK